VQVAQIVTLGSPKRGFVGAPTRGLLMASGLFRTPAVFVPLGVLLLACGAALVLPLRMVEPDDDDYFYGMHAFAQGYPLVLLALPGLLLMGRRRLRPGLFLGLWLGLFWGVYLCYGTIRADSFQLMWRKLSPAPRTAAPRRRGASWQEGQQRG